MEDVTAVDMSTQLARVASVLLPQRYRLSSPNPPVLVSATLGILEVVFVELLKNASSYSPADSTVILSVAKESTTVSLCVENQLLPEAVISESWFSPGYRGVEARTAYADGIGQGLPLVRRLLSLIGGEISLDGDLMVCRLTLRFRKG